MALALEVSINPAPRRRRQVAARAAFFAAALGIAVLALVAMGAPWIAAFPSANADLGPVPTELMVNGGILFALATCGFVVMSAAAIGASAIVPQMTDSKIGITVSQRGIYSGSTPLLRRNDVRRAFKSGEADVVLVRKWPRPPICLATRSEQDADALLQAIGFGLGDPLVLGTDRNRLALALVLGILTYVLATPNVFPGLHRTAGVAQVLIASIQWLWPWAIRRVRARWECLVIGRDGLRVPHRWGSRFIPYTDILASAIEGESLVLYLTTKKGPWRIPVLWDRKDIPTTKRRVHQAVESGCAAAAARAAAARVVTAGLAIGPSPVPCYRVASAPLDLWLDVVADGASDLRTRVQAAKAVWDAGDDSLRRRLAEITEGSACSELHAYGRLGG